MIEVYKTIAPGPSMWAIRYAAFDFFVFLTKIKLTTKQPPQTQIQSFVRRLKSRFDLS